MQLNVAEMLTSAQERFGVEGVQGIKDIFAQTSKDEISQVADDLTTIYNNSGKKFKWYYVTQGRNDSTLDAYNFITGTVPSYTSGSTTYNSVTITTGGNP